MYGAGSVHCRLARTQEPHAWWHPPMQGFWINPWMDSMPKDKQREVLATALEHMRSGLLPPAKGGWQHMICAHCSGACVYIKAWVEYRCHPCFEIPVRVAMWGGAYSRAGGTREVPNPPAERQATPTRRVIVIDFV